MPKKKAAAKRLPKQKSLPGMQDRKIVVLERAALRYADIRDERMAWTKKEVEAKKRVQTLMHEQKRQHYQHSNVEILLEPEGEKVVVRIRGRKQSEDEPETQPVEPVEEPEGPEGVPAEEPEENPDAQYAEVDEEQEEEEEPSAF